jgi:hypothetical protein
MHLPFQEKRPSDEVETCLLLRGETNISRHYRYATRAIKDFTFETALAYITRRKDRVFYPTTDSYNNAYNIIGMNSLPSKTKKNSLPNS